MATISKRNGRWRAEVRRVNLRKSKTFATKTAAQRWATALEADIDNHKLGSVANKTLGQLLQRYSDEVAVHKKGWRQEVIRLARIGRDPVAATPLLELSAVDMAGWRDRRLREVSAASVRRDWNVISHAINVAINEWQWLHTNPLKSVKKPAPPPARDRRVYDHEIELLRHCSGVDHTPETKTARTFIAFLLAIESGMRAGEIAGLTRKSITGRVAHLPMTKNGTRRDVPLSAAALKLLEPLGPKLLDLSSDQISSLFRKIRDRAGLDDLHFHDSRHEAITRLADKLDVLELARMVGIKDLKILMVYYNKTAEQLADKL
ncbi:MAG: tyrosine-type recombinase/integrase [Candidatus Reddybacter sp.]